jgi:site-specific DNA recombinase
VSWNGAKNPNGRHEALVDRETFERVQQVMKTAMLSGNRTRKHKHYLRGSLACGYCGRRMVFHRVRGRGGIYEYFGCLSHQGRRGSCGARHVQVADIEHAVERYYGRVSFGHAQREAVRKAVRDYSETLMLTARKESDRHARRLHELQREQQKLLQLFYKGSVAEEVLAAEQGRIERERTEARRWSEAATRDASQVMDTLDEALALLEKSRIFYRQAAPTVRRLLNQAIFKALLIRDEDVADAEYAPWAAAIERLARSLQECPEGRQRPARAQRGNPELSQGQGFNKAKMVPRAGLEPAPPD